MGSASRRQPRPQAVEVDGRDARPLVVAPGLGLDDRGQGQQLRGGVRRRAGGPGRQPSPGGPAGSPPGGRPPSRRRVPSAKTIGVRGQVALAAAEGPGAAVALGRQQGAVAAAAARPQRPPDPAAAPQPANRRRPGTPPARSPAPRPAMSAVASASSPSGMVTRTCTDRPLVRSASSSRGDSPGDSSYKPGLQAARLPGQARPQQQEPRSRSRPRAARVSAAAAQGHARRDRAPAPRGTASGRRRRRPGPGPPTPAGKGQAQQAATARRPGSAGASRVCRASARRAAAVLSR